MTLGFAPISSVTISDLPHWKAFVLGQGLVIAGSPALSKLYAATVPFITRNTDVPANQAFEGTLEATLRVDRSITGRQDGYGGFAVNISELSLINADGFYDDVSETMSVNGQSIFCMIGQMDEDGITVGDLALFERVAKLIGERFIVDRGRVTIQMRDPGLLLSTETVQQGIYAGTGALEGDSSIAGKRRPFGDGVVFNATPALVQPSELLYQFNDGPVASVQQVKDGGVPLAFFADYATSALLRAAGAALSIPAGYYATCIAEGYFELGGANEKQVTIDFTGLRLTTADIIQNVALNAVGLTNLDLDIGSFTTLNLLQPASVGFYLDENSSMTCADMFTALMNGIGGWHGMKPLGTLTVQRFDSPSSADSVASYDSAGGDIVDIDVVALPSGVDPPPHRRRVTYKRNYTVMTDLFGLVTEDDPQTADLLRSPFSVASTGTLESNAILANFPGAPDPEPIEAYFAYQTDALAEAERLYALYSQGFRAFRFVVKNALFVHQIGETVEVTDSRLRLSAGRFVRLVEVNDDCSRMVSEMVGFG
jgi:hypothetical protein